jgi:hypothetical protein
VEVTFVTEAARGIARVLASTMTTLVIGAAALPGWSARASADPALVTLELNKLEPQDKACRAYLVVGNNTDAAFSALKLDLVMFQNDGLIGRWFALDLAPLRPRKRSVKLFDLDVPCDRVGNFLLNDVIECQAEPGPVGDCLARLEVSSLGAIKLLK